MKTPYRVVSIYATHQDVAEELNKLAAKGWAFLAYLGGDAYSKEFLLLWSRINEPTDGDW